MRRLTNILHYLLFALILTLMALYLTLQLPSVQTYAINRGIDAAESMFDADIELSSVHFKPFNTIVLKGLNVIDRAPFAEDARDTLLSVGSLSVRFSLTSLFGPNHDDVILKEVKLRDAQFNLVIEDNEYSNNLSRMFKLVSPEEPVPMPDKDIFTIRSLTADNLTYTMRNYIAPITGLPESAINWSNMGVDRIKLRAHNFRISHRHFYATVEHMSFHERTGWDVKELTADVAVGEGLADIRNIHLYDGRTDAYLDYSMTAPITDYADYVNKVVMKADIRSSRWSLDALAHFIPPLNPDSTTFVHLKGKMHGPVADLCGDNLHLDFENSSIGFTLNGGVSKLPDVDNMTFDAHLDNLTFRTEDVCRAINSIAPKARLDLGGIGKGMLYSADVDVTGPINKMKAIATVHQGRDGGSATVNAIVENVLRMGNPPIKVSGKVSSDDLKLQPFIGDDTSLGRLSMSSGVNVTVPSPGGYLSAKLDSLKIKEMEFNGYNCRNISGNIMLQGTDLTADIVADDPALDADITIWSDKYAYNGALLVRKADLHALNVDKRGASNVGLNMYGRLDKDLDRPQGNARLSDILLSNGDGTNRLDDIALEASNNGGKYDISLTSGVADANFHGNRKAFTADFVSGESESLLAFILPGGYMEYGTRVSICLDTLGNVSGDVKSGRIAVNGNFIKDLSAVLSGNINDLKAEIMSSNIHAAGFDLNNSVLNAGMADSTITVSYAFSNLGTPQEADLGDGKLDFRIKPLSKGRMDIFVEPSRINMNGHDWTLQQSAVSINGTEIDVDGFMLRNNDKWIKVDGRMSAGRRDVLKAQISNLDLSVLNRFTATDIGLSGVLNADGAIYSPYSEGIPEFTLDADAKNIRVSDTDLGDIAARSVFDKDGNRMNITVNEHMAGSNPLNAEAVYLPANKTIDALAYLEDFPIGFAQGFLPDVFSRLGGTISGRVAIDGPVESPNISCTDGKFNDTLLEVAFTHVPYKVNGSFEMDNSGIHFVDAAITDRFTGKGTARGGLNWSHFKDMALDLHFDAENIEATNIPAGEPGVFYGNMFGTGTVDITGPFDEITLSADVAISQASNLHIVTSGQMDATKGNLLTFTDPFIRKKDPYEDILKKYGRNDNGELSNFRVRLHTIATPQLNVFLDLGSSGFAAGLNGTGRGTIDLAVDSYPADFKIYGDYTVNEGSFNVNASNLVHRSFNISNGSSIKFEGDVMESAINLDAIYQTKASIATLIADTTSVSNRRQVNCGINIQNTLNNPLVDFSINIPDLDPSVKSRVESALSTEDKVQKQFLSLLLSNNFLPDEQSGIVNNSSLLYSNVSELMANQVNNIFTKLDIPLDLGLNYQPSDRGGTDLFDVALSTQLFNNRVIIGGTLGNRQKVTSSNDVLFGDLDIQYKVIRSGALRLTAFSHSVDQYTNALDNAQRNGIGVTWQQEFDTLPQWFKALFSDKARREVLEGLAAEEEKKTVTLILDE